MRLQKKNTKSKLIILIIASILVVCIAAFTAYSVYKNTPKNSSQQQTTHDDANSGIREEQVQNGNTDPTPTEEDGRTSKGLTPSNEEQPQSSGSLIKPTIARAEKYGSTIEVVATFPSTATGHCELTLSKDGAASISRTAPITVGPSYYICGFTVENISGTGWTASVKHVSGAQQSDTVKQKVE
ncbi:hypothetical protein KI440_00275 [Candidatus Saccharibacteria bacterium TM7i]|nr:hypothetical protein KI440_00275 [Candidatus Saccharibacteria bacterium TM7i]